jgi:hypothetical protein
MRLLNTHTYTLISSLIFNGGKFLFEVVLVSQLIDSEYKTYAMIILFSTYIGSSNLGLLTGVSLLGGRFLEKPTHKKLRLKAVRLILILLALVIGFIATLVLSLFLQKDYNFIDIFLVASSLLVFNTVISLLKMNLKFKESNFLQIYSGVFFIIASLIVFTSHYQLIGVYGLLSLSLMIPLFISGAPRRLFHFFSLSESKLYSKYIYKSFRLGFPIMTLGLVYTLLVTIDRVFVGHSYDDSLFKEYNFSMVIMGVFHLVISVVASVNFPRLNTLVYSSKTNDYASFIHKTDKQAFVIGVACVVIAVFAAYILKHIWISHQMFLIMLYASPGLIGVSLINSHTIVFHTFNVQLMLVKSFTVIVLTYLFLLFVVTIYIKVDVHYVALMSSVFLCLSAMFIRLKTFSLLSNGGLLK